MIKSRTSREIVVIGAGIAGAAAAAALVDRGQRVTVLDRGRGPGGRCSTRRAGDLSFDHGAQYFTVREERFRRRVEAWAGDGVVDRWRARVVDLPGGAPGVSSRPRWVGVPGMSRIARHLLEGVDARFGVEAATLLRADDRWRVRTATGEELGGFDDVVSALPAPQAVRLLHAVAPELARRARGVEFEACWAVLVAFDQRLEVPFDGARVRDGGPLAWLARDGSKPGRAAGGPDTWVIHAGHEWSAEHRDGDGSRLAPVLLGRFTELCGAQRVSVPDAIAVHAHRWGAARARACVGTPCLHDPGRSIVLCGDWLLGERIEAAYLSGTAAAERILAAR